MRRARITVSALVVGGAVAVSPLGPVNAAGAAGAVDAITRPASVVMPEFGTVTDSALVQAPVMLHGTLTNATGAAMSGAEVLLSAWPSNETVRVMPIGSTFTTTPIAWTVADVRGAYTLRSALTPALGPLLGKDGLDIQLDVFHAGRQYTYLSQVLPGGALGWLRPSLGEVTDLATRAASARHNGLAIAFGRSAGAALPAAPPAACPPDADGCEEGPRTWPGGPPCLERKVATRETMTTVATAVARRGVTANVSYARGAMSELSAGISYNGGISFGVGGQRIRASNFEATFDPKTGTKRRVANWEYKVVMEHAVIAHECLGNKPGEYRVRGYRTSPNGTTGGFDAFPSSYPVWACKNLEPAGGRDVSAEQAEAFTYTRGFGFSPIPGASFIGLATSGYSDTVKVKFVFPKQTNGQRPQKRWWCGHSGNPTDKGQRVQAFVQ